MNRSSSFYIALLIAFIDNMGVGLVYPIFASLLFDPHSTFLSPEVSAEARGWWLGILIAAMPLAQFFCAAMWGSWSDAVGRKKPLRYSMTIGLIAYGIALCAVFCQSFWLLLAFRILAGVASGNISIVQAVIVDLFPAQEEKTKNFGLLGMALGAGFTLGPFLGGVLSSFGYFVPFLFALLLTLINLWLVRPFFKETITTERPFSFKLDLGYFTKAFQMKGLRTIFLCCFLHNFGWSYFFEFSPVYFISHFQFTSGQLGLFYGLAGAFYALSTGLLIRPMVKRFKPETLFFSGNGLTALFILAILLLSNAQGLWIILFFICYFTAFVTPSLIALASNRANQENQGEVLGIMNAVNAVALVLSPLCSGSFIGEYPDLSIKLAGMLLLAASLVILAVFRARLFQPLRVSS